MQSIHYRNQTLMLEECSLQAIATDIGTPCYVYSRQLIEANWLAFSTALQGIPHRICYAVKANSNLAILNLLARLQSGFDIVSGGELERVLIAGGDPQQIVFSGVSKSAAEISRALDVGIGCFNTESLAEIQRIHAIAKTRQTIAPIALRINPNIDANTHPYISTGLKENKFGIDVDTIPAVCAALATMPHIKVIGIACHIGSQLTTLAPFAAAMERVIALADELDAAGFTLEHINIGGGLGVHYQTDIPPSIADYITQLRSYASKQHRMLVLEPGRAIVANAGVLLTRVEYLKKTALKHFAIVDAGMNDLLRPALYSAWHDVKPVIQHADIPEDTYDIVGPVCESADFLGKNRALRLQAGDVLAVLSAGAYGFTMSSNYNSRPRCAEVMVDHDKTIVIRQRETVQALFQDERLFFA